MNLLLLPRLTKTYILDRISQEEIFQEFLGITSTDISKALNHNVLICSPLRTDNNPTCGFYYSSKGILRFHDFAGYFSGDCFDVVGYRNYLNSKDSVEFNKILEIVAKTFRLHKYQNAKVDKYDYQRLPTTYKKQETHLDLELRNWNNYDEQYWKQYLNININIFEFLNSNYIFPVYTLSINKQLTYSYAYNDPAYAIYCGHNEQGGLYKIYFPLRKTVKWLMNHSRIMGHYHIKQSEKGVVAKSFKDMLTLRSYDIPAISVISESKIPTEKEVAFLYKHWKTIYCFMDFDFTGIKFSNRMRKLYKFNPIFLSNGRFGTPDFKVKDISDFRKEYGHHLTKTLLENTFNCDNEKEFYDFLIDTNFLKSL